LKGEEMERVFQGRIVHVETGTVTLPNQQQLEVEVVRHPGGAAVVALDNERRVCLLHQYRVVTDNWLWELPAGKIDDAEPSFETAQRELAEEAGCKAEQWQPLGEIVSSPGVFDEVIHLYLARGLTPSTAQQEEHEIFELHWIPLDEAVAWAHNGKIADAKSIVALFRAQALLDAE
jgi:ADP-ribose pyrophosphatase